MKIGINARFLAEPYTGIGKYTYHLIEALSKEDPVNDYFIFTPQLIELPLPDNFKLIRVPEGNFSSPSLRKYNWEHVLVPKEMKKWEIDLAHFLYPSNPSTPLGIPTIVTVHDMIPWRLPEYNSRLRSKLYHLNAKRALKKADHIITVSQFSKDEVMEVAGINEKNISVTPLAPGSANMTGVPPKLNLRRQFLIYVGGYDPRKNVPTLMRAYQKFVANHYPIDLVLVGAKGKGFEEFLTDEFIYKVAGRFPIRPKGSIIFTEPLLESELSQLYKQALALVHPSVYEGFNLPLVEAMQEGLPLIIADIPVNREVAGQAALYLNPETENSFGLGIHAFLNDRALREQLRLESEKQSGNFNWQKTAEQTLDVYGLFT